MPDRGNSKFEIRSTIGYKFEIRNTKYETNSKLKMTKSKTRIRMTSSDESLKDYDLEERTYQFAKLMKIFTPILHKKQ